MLLRERLWRDKLNLKKQKTLPKVYHNYSCTNLWVDQLHVLDMDLARMPRMNRQNVIKLVKRHAAMVPNHPYTQGHLYLIRTMALVFGDECSLFWGYSRICRMLHPYGPDTAWGKIILPTWVFKTISGKLDICQDMFDVVIRLRWVYILFGQTFTNTTCICTIWDYILNDTLRIHKLCCALLTYGIEHECASSATMCDVQRFSMIVSAQYDSEVVAAELIARAQAVCV